MSVRILTARPHRLFASVAKELGQLEKQGEKVVLLVPEQFTLAAERRNFAHRQNKSKHVGYMGADHNICTGIDLVLKGLQHSGRIKRGG